MDWKEWRVAIDAAHERRLALRALARAHKRLGIEYGDPAQETINKLWVEHENNVLRLVRETFDDEALDDCRAVYVRRLMGALD